jgi:diaminopimelate decarboxylase
MDRGDNSTSAGITPPATATPRAARRDRAIRAAAAQGLLTPAIPILVLLDITGIRKAARSLRTAFAAVTPSAPVLHAFTVEATLLVPVPHLLRTEGLGADTAGPANRPWPGRPVRTPPLRSWTPPPRPRPNSARH